MIDKSKLKNWIPGDTFAVKIENTDSEIDGRYLILTMFNHPYRENSKNGRYFHVKITKKKEKPTSKEEINKLESVITLVTLWNMRFYPFKGLESLEEWKKRTKNRVFVPDEFNYLNTYSIEIWLKRGIPLSNFEFLGNYDIETPKNEFMTESIQLYFNDPATPFNYFVKRLIKDYRNYNLRESSIYTKAGLEETKKSNKEALKHVKWLNKTTQKMRKESNKEE